MIKSKQKFFRGQRVKIADIMQPKTKYFKHDIEAIIIGSYTDYSLFSRDCVGPNNYQLLLITKEHPEGEPRSWYPENFLILINDDRDAGEQILQNYQYKL